METHLKRCFPCKMSVNNPQCRSLLKFAKMLGNMNDLFTLTFIPARNCGDYNCLVMLKICLSIHFRGHLSISASTVLGLIETVSAISFIKSMDLKMGACCNFDISIFPSFCRKTF